MTSIEERSNNKDRITKTIDFLQGTTKKLGNSENINDNTWLEAKNI